METFLIVFSALPLSKLTSNWLPLVSIKYEQHGWVEHLCSKPEWLLVHSMCTCVYWCSCVVLQLSTEVKLDQQWIIWSRNKVGWYMASRKINKNDTEYVVFWLWRYYTNLNLSEIQFFIFKNCVWTFSHF